MQVIRSGVSLDSVSQAVCFWFIKTIRIVKVISSLTRDNTGCAVGF